MTWQAVARKDFNDGVRSWALWLVAGLFVLVSAGPILLFAILGDLSFDASQPRQAVVETLLPLSNIAGLLIPITSLLVGYNAIAGERESGSIKLLLSLPHERRDILLGKIVGRSLIVAAAIGVGFGTAFLITLALLPTPAIALAVPFTALTVAFSTAFVSLAVGFSAFTASSTRAATAAFGTFALFSLVWNRIPNLLYFALAGSLRPEAGQVPGWFLFVRRLNPSGAYDAALRVFQDTSQLEAQLGGPVPFYLSWWFALLILCAWIVVPAWIGYVRFRDADL